MTILLAAPHSDLEYARAERSNWLASGLDVVEVPAPVDIVSFTRALQAAEVEGVVILGHGRPDGIPMDNGELLDYDTLTPCIRGRVQWMYLGVCDSYPLAEELTTRLGVPVLCTVRPVYDRYAYAMGSGLAGALSQGESFISYATRQVDPTRHFKFGLPSVPEADASFRRYIYADCL